ncbi:MAG: molybdopterin synthase catalytic subunit [Flavobacteriales bacterium]|jgi:molybdopterin synthase catalytic subunit
MISVQTEDFSLQDEYQRLLKASKSGAVVTFVGLVRDFGQAADATFFLQHYPGMTESVLEKIELNAHKRWQLLDTRIIHRVGELPINEQIVFVGVSSAHRKDAFAACEFMIDILKTEAPFWKKEGKHWVDAKGSDKSRAERWL